MKKILILANNDVGLYKFRKELIRELLKEHEVYISLPNGDYVEHLKRLGCNFMETPLNRRGMNPFQDLSLLMKYVKIIKEIKPDVVLTYTIKPNIFGGVACRINKTTYFPNVTGLGTAFEKKGLMQRIILFLHQIAFKKAKNIFVQNIENKKFLELNGIINKNGKLIPGSGVNLEEYSLLEYPEEEEINFVFISRIMKEKGIDYYLNAAKAIKSKYPKTSFHVCGFCEEDYSDILKDYEDRGIIKYHGMVTDIQSLLRKMHCTVHPTYYPEGMSNVLLESASSGRPIITTNRSGCREIVDDGVNGYLVMQRNTKDLIDKIEKFLNKSKEEKQQFGLEGRRKVEKEFDREIVINAYISEIELIGEYFNGKTY
ncbi:glycosyltransferase family 4 protein [Paenalkalicoccus suaedae]|uniref:Glycosyltransferase family 4 protein n=1 Tax=Paenalkalicoccus suaedae TaxID=2592382 RepID=A0A859FHJ1_9BACI|nr:glycosyltransferase family 4 protein [Paenalkalicoccus suaedae]QKS72607.1 glycosyltransferase family 4 protein [Paenalkalicoccus suaedae]